jgi:hypothetical protein
MRLSNLLLTSSLVLCITVSSIAQEVKPASTAKDTTTTVKPKKNKKTKVKGNAGTQVTGNPNTTVKGAPVQNHGQGIDEKNGKGDGINPNANNSAVPEVKGSMPVITETKSGTINWTQQYITAKGSSVLDTVRFKNPAQARMMATRGAMVVAQRNLLEIVKGVEVTSETTVQDMVATSDNVYTRIDGVIKGAQQVGEPIVKDGMVEITMRVPLYETNGLAPAIYDNIPETPRDVNVAQRGEAMAVADEAAPNLEKIAFNMAGKKINPSMFPVIVDENNNLVLDLSRIYDPKTGKFPKIVQASREILKEAGYGSAVKIIDVISSKDGKIVINNDSARKINWGKIGKTAASVAKFLMMLI